MCTITCTTTIRGSLSRAPCHAIDSGDPPLPHHDRRHRRMGRGLSSSGKSEKTRDPQRSCSGRNRQHQKGRPQLGLVTGSGMGKERGWVGDAGRRPVVVGKGRGGDALNPIAKLAGPEQSEGTSCDASTRSGECCGGWKGRCTKNGLHGSKTREKRKVGMARKDRAVAWGAPKTQRQNDVGRRNQKGTDRIKTSKSMQRTENKTKRPDHSSTSAPSHHH